MVAGHVVLINFHSPLHNPVNCLCVWCVCVCVVPDLLTVKIPKSIQARQLKQPHRPIWCLKLWTAVIDTFQLSCGFTQAPSYHPRTPCRTQRQTLGHNHNVGWRVSQARTKTGTIAWILICTHRRGIYCKLRLMREGGIPAGPVCGRPVSGRGCVMQEVRAGCMQTQGWG